MMYANSGRKTPMQDEPKSSPLPSRKHRVFIVDDHAILRQGLAALINGKPDLEVCGESESAEEALREIPKSGADFAIVDLSLNGMSGLELIKSLRLRRGDLPVLVLSMHDELFFAERALRAGANGYLMKNRAVADLEQALRHILEGGVYVSHKVSDHLLRVMTHSERATQQSSMELLSDREIEVFEMVGRGYGNVEISRKLHLSTRTVEGYRARIKEKLDLKDAAQLFHHALAWLHGKVAGPSG